MEHAPQQIPLSEGDVNCSSNRRQWLEEIDDSETRGWLEEDERWFLHQSLSTPCLDVLESAAGSSITDLAGRSLLDFHGNSVHQVGYGHPAVMQAIKQQVDTLPFCPRRFTCAPAIRLARKLAELAPGNLNKVLLAPGGAEAISIALKIAREATGRFKTISFWDSFHGAGIDTISIGGEALFRGELGPLLPGSGHIPPPNPSRCVFGCKGECSLACAGYLEYVLERETGVGALIAEPVRSTVVGIPPDGYWQRIREICDRHGVMLILDEIPICLGRTGTMFACEATGITPDLLVIGKGLGGGVWPLAAVIARDDLRLNPARALGHFTHEKSPVGSAAALATIEVIESDDLCGRSQSMGEYALDCCKKMQHRQPAIGDVRGIGLLLALELVKSDGAPDPETADRVLYRCLRNGLSFKVSGGNVVTLCPPLTISEEDINRALSILEKSIELECDKASAAGSAGAGSHWAQPRHAIGRPGE
ncbi:MAG TPA: aspartate aminotransferase family protein [Chthonomonadales bacterium]|nr:aspartate aminotransferase family protein [Chthonomonadales bacterium]